MAGNRDVNFHRLGSRERLAAPHRATGRARADPTTGREKGALKRCRWQRVRSPRGQLTLAPADGVPRPSHWRATEQEARPALSHPSQPPCAGGLRRRTRPHGVALRLRRCCGAGAPAPALASPAVPTRFLPARHATLPLPAALLLAPAVAVAVAVAVAEERSPLGSPLPWLMAGNRRQRRRSGDLKPCPRCAAGRLDPASRAGSRSAPDFRAA